MATSKDTALYRKDDRFGGKLLTPEERIKLIKPYLPPAPSESESRRHGKQGKSRLGVRRFLKQVLFVVVYTIIHTCFSLYIRLRQAYHGTRDHIYSVLYYHHRTPDIIARDCEGLKRRPKHLSVILKLEDNGRGGAELEQLVNEVSDISAWSASAGIPVLSIYEKTGILKNYLPEVHRAVSQKLSAYFGPLHPALTLQAPHLQSIESNSSAPTGRTDDAQVGHLNVMLISAEDGRDSLVDLTKTLAEMAQRDKISPADVSIDLVDAELSESVMGEPDLLLLFGPHVELAGYPPWQARLTEIFHVPDNQGVGYQVFLRGLYKFAKAEMRLGR